MKRLLPLLLSAAVLLSLAACDKTEVSEPVITAHPETTSAPQERRVSDYFVRAVDSGETEEYFISYKNADGSTEDIVSVGAVRQPIVIIKNRIYFCEPSAVVSVDLYGGDRHEHPMLGINSMLSNIAFYDDEWLYCFMGIDEEYLKIRSDFLSFELVSSPPKELTQLDYSDLLMQSRRQTKAYGNKVFVKNSSVVLDSSGSVSQIFANVWCCKKDENGRELWQDGQISALNATGELTVDYFVINEVSADTPDVDALKIDRLYKDIQVIEKSAESYVPDDAQKTLITFRFGDFEGIAQEKANAVSEFTISSGTLKKAEDDSEGSIVYVIVPQYSTDYTGNADVIYKTDQFLSANWSVVLK